jgi:very-short-patch-repair endonuclease
VSRALNRELVAYARTQRGLLGAADAVRILKDPDGVETLLKQGHWNDVLPGVLASATLEGDRDLVESAAMLWEPRSSLSHFSSARRDGIWVPDNDEAWLTTELCSRKRSLPQIRVFRSRQFAQQFQTDGFHRWTPSARTVVDLSGRLTRKQLEAVLLSAIRLERTTAVEVQEAAEGLSCRTGITMLREVTALWTPERESLLEDRLHAHVLTVLPDGVTRQHPVGRVRLDVAIERLRLGFEADGLLFHSTDEQIARDQHRDRWLMGQGWQVVRFREGTLDDYTAVRADIRAIADRRTAPPQAA